MRQKIVAVICVERNTMRILHRAHPLTLNVYSVSTISKETVLFEVFDESKKTLFKIALDALFAIHRKLIEEGKASFEFRLPTAHHAGAFDTIFVFVQKAQPKNLALLVDSVVAHFQKQRKGATEPLLVRKRNEEAFLESEEAMRAHISAKPAVVSSSQSKATKASERRAHAAMIGMLAFLSYSERFRLGEVCRSFQRFCDAFVTHLNMRSQPPASIFARLLQRFKNIEVLSIDCEKLLRKPLDYNGRVLFRLQHIDLSRCNSLKEGTINQFLGFSRQVKHIALPFAATTFSHFCRFAALKGQIESLTLKGQRLEPFRVNHRAVRDFLDENACLRTMKFLQLEGRSIPENLPCSLRSLKIGHFVSEEASCEALRRLVAANPHLEALAINNILLGQERISFSVADEDLILQSFKSCLALKHLTIGSFFSTSMLNHLCSWIAENKIALIKLRVCNLHVGANDVLRIIDLSPNLQKIDISNSNIPTSYLSSHLNAGFQRLRKIVLADAETEVRLFREFLAQNKLGRVHVVYKSR